MLRLFGAPLWTVQQAAQQAQQQIDAQADAEEAGGGEAPADDE